MRIVILNYGKTEFLKSKNITENNKAKLTKEGIKELNNTKKEVIYPKTDLYIAANTTAAVETFEILFGDQEHIDYTDNRLNKIDFKDFTCQEAQKMNLFQNYLRGTEYKDVESLSDFTYRIFEVITDVLYQMKQTNKDSVTVITHSLAILILLKQLENLSVETVGKIKIPKGKGYILEVEMENQTINLKKKELLGEWVEVIE